MTDIVTAIVFWTAIEILHGLTAETESLAEVKGWLIASLSEARDVQLCGLLINKVYLNVNRQC